MYCCSCWAAQLPTFGVAAHRCFGQRQQCLAVFERQGDQAQEHHDRQPLGKRIDEFTLAAIHEGIDQFNGKRPDTPFQVVHRFRPELGREQRAKWRVLGRVHFERDHAKGLRRLRNRHGGHREARRIELHRVDVGGTRRNPVPPVVRRPDDVGHRHGVKRLPRAVHVDLVPFGGQVVEVHDTMRTDVGGTIHSSGHASVLSGSQ